MGAVTLPSFDTLQYVKRLRAADVPEKQAEAQAEALRAVLVDQSADLATKADIALLRKDMEALENRLTIKLSAVMVGLIAFAGAMQALVSRLL